MSGPAASRKISFDRSQLRPEYDAVVVGSGYGAGPIALRLAQAGWSVCVLERGKEISAGEFPETLTQAGRSFQAQVGRFHLGHRNALFHVRVEQDVSVMLGCGLGGGSLINASVCLEAAPEVFEDEVWPSELVNDLDAVHAGYAAALAMLQPVTHPLPLPTKFDALSRSAAALGTGAEPAPINVTFTAGPNPAGVVQNACTGCGNCGTGCNEGAKNTIDRTYLAAAASAAHPAEIFCNLGVRTVMRHPDGGWVVQAAPSEARPVDPTIASIRARVVVLAAGTIGSTEILMRSAKEGLPVSSRLGSRFSGNSDVIGFSYDGSQPVHAIGWAKGSRPSWALDKPLPGPTITGMVTTSVESDPANWKLLEEGVIPGALAPLLPAIFWFGALRGIPPEMPLWRRVLRRIRELSTLWKDPWSGPIDRSQTLLVMGRDDADGRLRFKHDAVRVDWGGEGDDREFAEVDALMRVASHGDGASSCENPMSTLPLRRRMITSHPLGGCPMGEDARSGVVDHKGRVFHPGPDGRGHEVHQGLYVCDGSTIPRALGRNPSLTIAALAERAAQFIVADNLVEPAEGATA